MPPSSIWYNRICALALGIGAALIAVIGPCWWSVVRDQHPYCTAYKADFVSFYAAAKLMRTDRSALYDLEQQRMVQRPIDPSQGDWVLPYLYPPFFAVILLPLAWLPFPLAFIAMTLVNLVLLIISMKVLMRKLQLNRQQSNYLTLATFCNFGVHYALLEAQTSFIVLTLLVLYVSALDSQATARAGIWSGLLFFKPQLTLVPLIVLICRRKWLALGLAVGILGLLGLASLFAVGREGLEQYFAVSRRVMSGEDYFHFMRPEQPDRMNNLRALTYFFFTTPWRDYIWWISTVALAAFVTVVSRRNDGVDGISPEQWTSILVALILVSPHFHDHDLTLLIVLTAFYLKRAGDVVTPAVAFAFVALGILPLINTVAYPHLPPLLPLLLLIFLIGEQWRAGQRGA